MKKYIGKYFLALATITLTLPSCQKDEIETSHKETAYYQISDTIFKQKPTTKRPFGQKRSEVYFLNAEGTEYHKYTTIKISNPSRTICQEWFCEDLHEEWFQPYSFQPGDEKGLIHGYYYPWGGTLDDVNQSKWDSDWDYMIFNANKEPEKGFHIPNYSDINTLCTIITNKAQIRRTLKVEWDGNYQPDIAEYYSWQDDGAVFWIYPRDPKCFKTPDGMDPRKEEGCGVILSWYKDNSIMGDGFWIGYTQEPTLRCNVRLVRDITEQQW